jgi:hypothetical protein
MVISGSDVFLRGGGIARPQSRLRLMVSAEFALKAIEADANVDIQTSFPLRPIISV